MANSKDYKGQRTGRGSSARMHERVFVTTPTQGRYAGQMRYGVSLGRGEVKFFDTPKEANRFAREFEGGAIVRGQPRGRVRAIRGVSSADAADFR